MNDVIKRLTGALVLNYFLGLSACHDPNFSRSSARAVKVVVVPKTDQTPFYARIPTERERVLVTSPEALRIGPIFDIPQDMGVFYVELKHVEIPPIVGEFYRHEDIRLFLAKNDHQAAVTVLGLPGHPHPMPVPVEDLYFPESKIQAPSTKSPSRHWRQANTYLQYQFSADVIDIDENRLRNDLESLSGARPVIIGGRSQLIANRATNENKSLARQWLRQEFEALEYEVSEHNYGSGINFIAEKARKKSSSDLILLVTAHLDTVQTAGADDDGSGVITSLSIARALDGKSLGKNLRFVAFDEEERGLIGSTAYAKHLAKNGEIKKVSVLNIEMTGYDSDDNGDFHAIDCNENSSADLTKTLLWSIKDAGIALQKIGACTSRSDHAVFWQYDRPAIVVSQNFFGGDGNPCYHKTCDTVARVNFDYFAKLTKAAANAVYRLTSNR